MFEVNVRDEFLDFNSTGKGGGGVLHMLKDKGGGDTQFKYAQLPITRDFTFWLTGIGCRSLFAKYSKIFKR